MTGFWSVDVYFVLVGIMFFYAIKEKKLRRYDIGESIYMMLLILVPVVGIPLSICRDFQVIDDNFYLKD